MHRTNTKAQTLFHLPDPAPATFNFATPDYIRIAVPKSSPWRTDGHWHTRGPHECSHLEAEQGTLQVSWWKEPRTGASTAGAKDYYFQPDYWTTWSRDTLVKEAVDLVVVLVAKEDLYRNRVSAILDADLFPSLDSTPYWLRAVFALLSWSPAAWRWLIAKLLYVQIQAIYYHFGYWEYHGGINALSWWQFTNPFDIGEHPAWAVRLQYRSQRLFSRAVQAGYYWVGLLMGIKGDYEEYNPRCGKRTGS